MSSEDDRQHRADLQSRRDDRGEEDEDGDELVVALPELQRPAGDRGEGLPPGDGQAEHRHGVREHVEKGGRGRQRERAVERVLAAAPQLLVASRTARRGARRELGQALHEVAVGAADERRIAERLVMARHALGDAGFEPELGGTSGKRLVARIVKSSKGSCWKGQGGPSIASAVTVA